METFRLQILAPDRPFYDGPCEYLNFPVQDGSIGVMAHHSPMIAAVIPGEVKFTAPGRPPQVVSVSEGMVKIGRDGVSVLVITVEKPEEIDVARARRAAAEAEETLSHKQMRKTRLIASMKLARAKSRIQIYERHVGG